MSQCMNNCNQLSITTMDISLDRLSLCQLIKSFAIHQQLLLCCSVSNSRGQTSGSFNFGRGWKENYNAIVRCGLKFATIATIVLVTVVTVCDERVVRIPCNLHRSGLALYTVVGKQSDAKQSVFVHVLHIRYWYHHYHDKTTADLFADVCRKVFHNYNMKCMFSLAWTG